ncbi:Extracellular exo-alpha-L-arabinofuranosidase precursor [Botrimarina colliarenosi]|uniref:non-reducing end alpha-L-arabinofuranosidase n=1 Tax=Botrimarina colliarenosi TaxID=2528001 RepID=A0A5C6AL46_9BACT|nr:alpha-L-arabinofuranosidase C-terminal domain-containing protein [Botrimarina colliarenosi]TWT99905.1 Extracellular exo-alpha-L-arabinofuranosidase precursor [Botrimarina colliarenosi]
MHSSLRSTGLFACLFGLPLIATAQTSAPLAIKIEGPPKPISTDLVGVFFEDINYAADGGLYAELIQNRSFDYSALEQLSWNPLSFWEVVQLGGGKGSLGLDAGRPLHPNNPTYAVLNVDNVGEGVGVRNPGFDGVPVVAGKKYNVSLFVRQLYVERRWGGGPIPDDKSFTLTARLEGPDGANLGETELKYSGSDWRRLEGGITADKSEPRARFVLLAHEQGGIALDMVSLFPQDTFRDRPNGLRNDLAESIEALEPKFVRFPGGCLVHGNGLANMYRWKDTIGPIEHRRAQLNIWGYHQTMGLGYFEYFQFCEDIGAKPLPVVPAAVSCQNSGVTGGRGQEGLPLTDMPAYVQEVLDLIEWANGPADSEWGSKRAAAGHPEPFNLEYLGVGNEDHITPVFRKRFEILHEAIEAKHPEITLIGTVGPSSEGPDYEEGWRIADALGVDMVDEHYYRSPEWFLENTQRYDGYDRDKSQVYLGEYAAHDHGRQATLRSALAEAAYLTHLERNADIVRLASYAPLLARRGHTQWTPDLIYFDEAGVYPTVNYYVQQLFSRNSGDQSFTTRVNDGEPGDGATGVFASTVLDSENRVLIVKLVNTTDKACATQIALPDGYSPKTPATESPATASSATVHVLTGDPMTSNPQDPMARGRSAESPMTPTSSPLEVAEDFDYEAPPHSLSVIRVRLAE